MDAGKLIDPDFLSAVSHQFALLRMESRKVLNRDIILSDTERKSWGVVRELSDRASKFPGTARMTKNEEIILANFAQWMVGAWHDLRGTPVEGRPSITDFWNPAL